MTFMLKIVQSHLIDKSFFIGKYMSSLNTFMNKRNIFKLPERVVTKRRSRLVITAKPTAQEVINTS